MTGELKKTFLEMRIQMTYQAAIKRINLRPPKFVSREKNSARP